MAVASLVLGILSVIFSFIPCFGWLSIIGALVGLPLGIVALVQAKKKNAPKGLALSGVILNGIALVVLIAWFTYVAVAVGNAMDELGAMQY